MTESVAKQPFESVSVNLYFVVDFGETEGFEEVDEKPEGELVHEYELRTTEFAPIEIVAPEQMAVFGIKAPDGRVFTVMVTESDFAQPFELVSVRV